MAKRFDPNAGPTQRQQRVAELVRHALAEVLSRGDLQDAVLARHVVTIPEVRMSPDLKLATAYVMPLGGKDEEAVLAGARPQQEGAAPGGGAPRQPEIRARSALPPRRDVRRGRAHRRAPGAPTRSATGYGRARAVPIPTSRRDTSRRHLMPDDRIDAAASRAVRTPRPRPKKRDVNGWIVLDKGVGMTSTHAVAVVKRALSAPRRPAMPARSIRSPPASCRSRSARRPRPSPSSWTAASPTSSPSPGASRPTRTTPRARSSRRSGPLARPAPTIEALLPRFIGRDRAGAAALLGHQDRGRARLRPRPRRRDGRAAGPHGRDRPAGARRIMTATARSSRPIAARAPMCGPSPAISAGRSAASAMSRPCAAPASARSRRPTPSW